MLAMQIQKQEIFIIGEQDCVCVMTHDPQTTYSTQARNTSRKLYFDLKLGSTVIDPWRCFKDKRYEIIYYGK
jgi:hypothetical protein